MVVKPGGGISPGMASTRRFNFLGQQRIDLPYLRAIESAASYDFDVLGGLVLAGDQPLVVSGFQFATAGAIGQDAEALVLRVANSVCLHREASDSGTVFQVPADRPDEVLSATNPRVQGGFTPGATNFVGIDLVRRVDDSTSDTAQFLRPDTNGEFPQVVPLGYNLDYRIVVSTTEFTSTPTVLPLAVVTTDTANRVISLVDARYLAFRLSRGGSNPQAVDPWPWPGGRSEASGALATIAGDRSITSVRDLQRAVQTRLWELGGGEYWYSQTADRNVRMVSSNPYGVTNSGFEFVSGNLHWRGLAFVFDNSSAAVNEIADQITDLPGLTDLVDGDCLYVDVDRTQDRRRNDGNALVVQRGVRHTLGGGAVPGNRFIIAWADGGQVYKRDEPTSTVITGINPGGTDTDIQFNDGGAFGGNAALTFQKTTQTLTSSHLVLTSDLVASGTQTASLSPTSNNLAINAGVLVYRADSGGILASVSGMQITAAVSRVLLFLNTGTAGIVLLNENTSSTAANRFHLGADTTVQPGGGILLWYDTASSRWRSPSLAGSGASSSGSAVAIQIADGVGGFQNDQTNFQYDTSGHVFSAPETHLLALYLDQHTSPAQITANQNDYNPFNFPASGSGKPSVLRLSTDASRTITGLVGNGSAGRIVLLFNVGTNPLVLASENTNSLAANRFSLGSDTTIQAGRGILLWYDFTSTRWRTTSQLATTGGGGGAAGTAGLVQYNDGAGNFAASASFFFDTTNLSLTVPGLLNNGPVTLNSSPTYNLSASQNDYSPSGINIASAVRLIASAPISITGLLSSGSGNPNGRTLLVFNAGTAAITLSNESSASTATNRFSFGTDLVLNRLSGVLLWYDSAATRWKSLNTGNLTGGSGAAVGTMSQVYLAGSPTDNTVPISSGHGALNLSASDGTPPLILTGGGSVFLQPDIGTGGASNNNSEFNVFDAVVNTNGDRYAWTVQNTPIFPETFKKLMLSKRVRNTVWTLVDTGISTGSPTQTRVRLAQGTLVATSSGSETADGRTQNTIPGQGVDIFGTVRVFTGGQAGVGGGGGDLEIGFNNGGVSGGGLNGVQLTIFHGAPAISHNGQFIAIGDIGPNGAPPTIAGTGTNGGLLWVQNGALKYMGSHGTVTTLAPA